MYRSNRHDHGGSQLSNAIRDLPERPPATHAKELSLTLSKLRSLLVATGYKTAAAIDRFDVKGAPGAVIGVDLMLSDGTVTDLLVEAS